MPLAVAPMEGVTIFPNRLWLWLASQPPVMTTPFLRVTATETAGTPLPHGFAPELQELRGLLPYALTPQLLTPDAETFLRACDRLPPDVAAFIELNCGCPAPSSAGKRAGSGMLRQPEAFGEVLARISSVLGADRFAVKMRIGYETADELEGLLPYVCVLPLARLTVHGRARADGYRGRARWDKIQDVAARARAPTWASGDVLGAESCARLAHAAPAACGVMIGRGILRNPWVFTEIVTGRPVAIAMTAMRQAIFCFALLNELWMRDAGKLLRRIASGKIDTAPCGTDPERWERLAAALSGLAFGAPQVLSARRATEALAVSPMTANRVRFLWGYLRTGLADTGDPLAAPRLMRAKQLTDLLEALRLAGEGPLTLAHRPAWDNLFSPSTEAASLN